MPILIDHFTASPASGSGQFRSTSRYAQYAGGGEPSDADYKALQDFLFRYIAGESGRLGIAVHVHAFEGAGNFFRTGGADPLLLEPVFNDPALRATNFVIVHDGGVFSAHAGAMLWKPNVFVDTSAMTLLYTPDHLAGVLKEWLSQFPNKVLFGSDASAFGPDLGWELTAWMGARNGRMADHPTNPGRGVYFSGLSSHAHGFAPRPRRPRRGRRVRRGRGGPGPRRDVLRRARPADARAACRVRAMLDTYCVTCHNQRLKTAGLALDAVDVTAPHANPEVWERVITRLRAGSMPPAGRPRPDAATYEAVAAWLETDIDRAWTAAPTLAGSTRSIVSIGPSTATPCATCSPSIRWPST